MDAHVGSKVEVLRRQGVNIPAPESIEIGDEVKLGEIRGPGTVLHAGTKLYGASLVILPGAQLGYEEPVTVESCAVGPEVKLAGGYFAGSVFLDRVVMAKGSQVRGGTLMEEEANGAHCVGLKQTILLPFVTLGSLINFCDILMAGGTSRKDHSEVGSSFIHFNFTPFGKSGDKVTASLVGDVARGVFYRSKRIFVGGHASLIGPIRIGYGAVLAAGSRADKDIPEDTLAFSSRGAPEAAKGVKNFDFLCYKSIRRKVEMGVAYTAQLAALWHWYDKARRQAARSAGDAAMVEAALEAIAGGVEARIDRMDTFCGDMDESIERNRSAGREGLVRQQRTFRESWPGLRAKLAAYAGDSGDAAARDAFLTLLTKSAAGEWSDFPGLIQRGLDEEAVETGGRWLESIVAGLCEGVDAIAPPPA